MFPTFWLVMFPEPLLKVKPETEYWGDTGADFSFCFGVEVGFFFFDCRSEATGSTTGMSVSYSSSSYTGLALFLVFDRAALFLREPCLDAPSSTPLLKVKPETEYWWVDCFGVETFFFFNCSFGAIGSSIGTSSSYSSSSYSELTLFLVFDWAVLFVREPCLEVPSSTSSSGSWYLVLFFFSSISDFLESGERQIHPPFLCFRPFCRNWYPWFLWLQVAPPVAF